MKKKIEKEKDEEIQNRRDFFKNMSKIALPVIAVIGLSSLGGLENVLGSTKENKKHGVACESGCSWSCEGSCNYTCEKTCKGYCEQTCQYECEKTCKRTCEKTCDSQCEGSCKGTCETGCWTWAARNNH